MHPGKWPKSVKFSSWREASELQVYGPAVTTVQPSVASSGTSGSSQRGSSSAAQMRPCDSTHRNAPIRAFFGMRVGSASCGMRVQAPSAP